MNAIPKNTSGRHYDPVRTMATHLAKRLSGASDTSKKTALLQALHELLDGQDDEARRLRTGLIIHLAEISNKQPKTSKAAASNSAEMLSTEAAATLMGRSRPYVAMLIDSKELAGATISSGGHRKVPRQSVMRWIKANKPGTESNYRKAGVETDIYSVSDEAFIKASARKSRRGA